MLEMNSDVLTFKFPEIHSEAVLNIEFQRTLRIPDDGKQYHLPPGLGRFPTRHVDDFKNRVPKKWLRHGGVLLPMYQSEALWINFRSNYVLNNQAQYPFAVKVSTGKVSAVTGEGWQKGLQKDDYLIIPKQPWLDGYVVKKGVIRQFVAAPLGAGFTAEEQITKKAEFGGIQIEVFPMKKEIFEKRFPVRIAQSIGVMRGLSFISDGVYTQSLNSCNVGATMDMGLAPGGLMTQQIFEDPYDFEDWNLKDHKRCFVHLANSMVWRSVTGENPPTTPPTAEEYTRAGLPWFGYYRDDLKDLDGKKKLKNLKSMHEMGKKKGVQLLPENKSVEVKSSQIKKLTMTEIRDGKWI